MFTQVGGFGPTRPGKERRHGLVKGGSSMDTNGYVTFLMLGVLLILVDGHIIYRSGRAYLQRVYQPEAARSMTQLVTVLFHLVMLGVLALISTINVDGGFPVRSIVARLGVVLLVLAAAHGVTMAILMRIRDERRQEQISDEIAEDRHFASAHDAIARPANSQRVDDRGPASPPSQGMYLE